MSTSSKRKKISLYGIFLILGLSLIILTSIFTFLKGETKKLDVGQVLKQKDGVVQRNNHSFHKNNKTSKLTFYNITANSQNESYKIEKIQPLNNIPKKHSSSITSSSMRNYTDYDEIDDAQHDGKISKNQTTPIINTLSSKSTACNPSSFLNQKHKINRIFFAHMRKAGGTTIRKYLEKVAEKYKLEYEVSEGTIAEMPHNATTFYVTNLREPISRLQSNYKYEGRWKCNVKDGYTAENSLSFEEFITMFKINGTVDRGGVSLAGRARPRAGTKLWRCAQNCYVRWLSHNPRSIDDMKQSYEIAHEKLSKYNLIIITEQLHDLTYVRNIERMFNVSGLEKRPMFCERKMEILNKQFPPVFRDDTMDEVRRINQMDRNLYKKFATCPNDTIHFPM